MKVNVGDYVRTKTGIHKLFEINENATVWKYYCDKKPTGEWDSSYEYIKIKDEDIIKSSSNIIDLIEVGDYVNGSKVQEIGEGYVEIEEYSGLNNDMPCVVKVNDIKSIVTKEQFKSMEYKVGE